MKTWTLSLTCFALAACAGEDLAFPRPVPAHRFLGGEKIKVFVPASVGETMEQIVTDDGNISIATGEIINIRGKTIGEAQSAIKEKLEAVASAKRVMVAIALIDTPPRRVFLNGEVKVPQAITLTPGSPLTLAAALASAGGTTSEADLTRVSVVRTDLDGTRRVIPYDASLLNRPGNIDLGPTLEQGDVINIGRGETFVLAGEVNKPGIYNRRELSIGPGEQVRLSRVLFGGGGLKSTANRKDLRLIRLGADGKKNVTQINIDDSVRGALNNENSDPVLRDGDIVLAGTTGGVAILGRVRNPGVYPLGGEKLRLTRLIALAGGFQEFAKTSSIVLIKANAPNATVQIDIGAITKRGELEKDIELEDGDLVFVSERVL